MLLTKLPHAPINQQSVIQLAPVFVLHARCNGDRNPATWDDENFRFFMMIGRSPRPGKTYGQTNSPCPLPFEFPILEKRFSVVEYCPSMPCAL